jgi:predicted ABC-type ATPase
VSDGPAPFVWLCGPSGVGKSSVGWELYCQVIASGIKAAYVDMDQISFARPAPSDDPENDALKARDLAVMWPKYRAAGARCLLTSGIVLDPNVITMTAAAVSGTRLIVCRLRARPDMIRERVFRRGRGGGPPLPGDELMGRSEVRLAEAAEDSIREADIMEGYGLGDITVDTDDLSITAVAVTIRARAGDWPIPQLISECAAHQLRGPPAHRGIAEPGARIASASAPAAHTDKQPQDQIA